MQKYYLYFLYSVSIDQYYIGVSSNPAQRLISHNEYPKGWTKRGIPRELVFMKLFDDKKTALSSERKIKSFKNRQIIQKNIDNEFDW
jgi:putative endonuclease